MKYIYLSWALPKPDPFFIYFFAFFFEGFFIFFIGKPSALLKSKKAEWVKRLKKTKSER